jgi:hypothetical protein
MVRSFWGRLIEFYSLFQKYSSFNQLLLLLIYQELWRRKGDKKIKIISKMKLVLKSITKVSKLATNRNFYMFIKIRREGIYGKVQK